MDVDITSTKYLTRNGAITGDLVLYDKGSFNYYLQSPTSVSGFIFVEYEIELSKPQINTSGALSAPAMAGALFTLTNANITTAAGSVLTTNNGFIASGKSLQVAVSGNYLVTVCFKDTAGNSTVINAYFGTTAQAVPLYCASTQLLALT